MNSFACIVTATANRSPYHFAWRLLLPRIAREHVIWLRQIVMPTMSMQVAKVRNLVDATARDWNWSHP